MSSGAATSRITVNARVKSDVVKGFFPHKFNVPKNQNYIGPLPGKEFFEAERFTPERKEAFDQWYEDEKACEDWSLHTKLREYCRSDVIVLGEACCIMTL